LKRLQSQRGGGFEAFARGLLLCIQPCDDRAQDLQLGGQPGGQLGAQRLPARGPPPLAAHVVPLSQQQTAAAGLPLLPAALELIAQAAGGAVLLLLRGGHGDRREGLGVAAQIPVELVDQRGGIQAVGLLLPAVGQRGGDDDQTVRPGGEQLAVQPEAAGTGLLAEVDLQTAFAQCGGQGHQLGGFEPERLLGQRPVELQCHHDVAGMYVGANLYRLALAGEDSVDQLTEVSFGSHTADKLGVPSRLSASWHLLWTRIAG